MSSSSSDEEPIHLGEDSFKIVVVGEPGCGKTSFIRAFYDNNFPADAYSFNGAYVYPCKLVFKNETRNVALLEFHEFSLTLEERQSHYFEADAIVFMYAIDDPLTFQSVIDKWFQEITDITDHVYMDIVLLGNKIDLRNDRQVIELLALDNQRLLTSKEVSNYFKHPRIDEFLTFLECSTKHAPSIRQMIAGIIRKSKR